MPPNDKPVTPSAQRGGSANKAATESLRDSVRYRNGRVRRALTRDRRRDQTCRSVPPQVRTAYRGAIERDLEWTPSDKP